MVHYWNYYPGFSILGFIFQMFFWGLIIILVVRLFKSSHCCQRQDAEDTGGENKSLEIVKERYAKGEIDKKEFEQLKKDLS